MMYTSPNVVLGKISKMNKDEQKMEPLRFNRHCIQCIDKHVYFLKFNICILAPRLGPKRSYKINKEKRA